MINYTLVKFEYNISTMKNSLLVINSYPKQTIPTEKNVAREIPILLLLQNLSNTKVRYKVFSYNLR